jgi:hypothetical protein
MGAVKEYMMQLSENQEVDFEQITNADLEMEFEFYVKSKI